MSERQRCSGKESGLTLVELVVSMALFGLVTAVVYGVLSRVQQSTADLLARADSTSAVRLALEQVDRNVRSASYIEVVGGTKLNVSTRVNDDVDKCMQWRVVPEAAGGVSLATNSWALTATPPPVSTWPRTTTDLVNTTTTPAAPVFSSPAAAPDSATVTPGLQAVTVRLLVRSPKAGGEPAEVQATISGRNATAGAATTTCSFP